MDRDEWRRRQVDAARRPVGNPDDLPRFEYHPDPLGTGSVRLSEAACECCGQARGYVYDGTVRGGGDPDAICPWCIDEGRAAETLGVFFNQVDGDVDSAPPAVRETVEQRTPGFSPWQETRWMVHCGDAAVFLGPAGGDVLRTVPGAVESLLADSPGWGEELLDDLTADGDATAYVFRCRRCGVGLAFWDAS